MKKDIKNSRNYNIKEDIKNSYLRFLLTDKPKSEVKRLGTVEVLIKQGKRSKRGVTFGIM
jgi:hypothetical protein